MNTDEITKNTDTINTELLFRSAITLLLVVITVIGLEFMTQIQELQKTSNSVTYVSNINAQMQRLVRLELVDEPSDLLILNIDSLLKELERSQHTLLFDDGTETAQSFIQVKKGWDTLKTEIYKAREQGWKATRLQYSAESTYYSAERLTVELADYFTYVSKFITLLQLVIISVVFLIVILVIARSIVYLTVIRKQKVEMNESYIDATTNLFNRTKCQKLLVETALISENSTLVIFDLNDLKVINDNLGHLVGDEFIAAFADSLKKAKAVMDETIFLGRYGGDEFIAYFEHVEEKQILKFLDEVENYTKEYNNNQKHFQVSYAVGYAVAKELPIHEKVDELFSLADERMYKAKVEMKQIVHES